MASSILHLLSSSCKHVGLPLASCSVLLKSHRTSSPFALLLLQAPSSSWQYIALPLASSIVLLKAHRTCCSKQVPSSSCKHIGLPVPSCVVFLLATTMTMVSDPMDVDSIGGVPIKEIHVLHRKLPSQTPRFGCYSNKDFMGGMPIKELLVPPPKTSNDKFIERLQAAMHGNTKSARPPPPQSPETCRFWLKGTCNRGARCRFVHGGDSMKEWLKNELGFRLKDWTNSKPKKTQQILEMIYMCHWSTTIDLPILVPVEQRPCSYWIKQIIEVAQLHIVLFEIIALARPTKK